MNDYSWIPPPKPSRTLRRAWTVFLLLILIGTAFMLNGCVSTMQVLDGADYVCVTGDLDGYFTDSRANGRGVKVPDGEVLTPELAEILCR